MVYYEESCVVWFIMSHCNIAAGLCVGHFQCLKKNQNAPSPLSIPQSGGGNVKTFRWDQRLQINTKPLSWHLNGEKPILVFIPLPALLQKNKQASDWVRVR